MAPPREDTRGILDPDGLLARVRFRRWDAAGPLRPYVEHYWLIDWDLAEPYVSAVLPHPSVNVVFQWPGRAELTGIGTGVAREELTGRGRVAGVQFRPGGFGAFAPGVPVSAWTGRRVPLAEVWPGAEDAAGAAALPDGLRVAALDALLLARGPRPDPETDLALRRPTWPGTTGASAGSPTWPRSAA